MLSNTSERWGSISIALHWFSAVAVIGLFASGWWISTLTYYHPWYNAAPWWHKSFGITLLAMTLLRVVWRLVTPTPRPLEHRHEALAAKLGHGLIYLLLLTVLCSGYLISTAEGSPISVFGWFEIPASWRFSRQATLMGTLHWYAAWTLVILAAGHALFALKHHFLDHRATLTRMLGRGS